MFELFGNISGLLKWSGGRSTIRVRLCRSQAALLGAEAGGIMRSMSFTVELPDSVAEALRLAPPDAEAEVRKELALALYARGILGFGKARELCGLTKWQFEELLGRRKVVRPYDEDDLAVDLAYARRGQ
jgi:predicted HTH domain antitoxin